MKMQLWNDGPGVGGGPLARLWAGCLRLAQRRPASSAGTSSAGRPPPHSAPGAFGLLVDGHHRGRD